MGPIVRCRQCRAVLSNTGWFLHANVEKGTIHRLKGSAWPIPLNHLIREHGRKCPPDSLLDSVTRTAFQARVRVIHIPFSALPGPQVRWKTSLLPRGASSYGRVALRTLPRRSAPNPSPTTPPAPSCRVLGFRVSHAVNNHFRSCRSRGNGLVCVLAVGRRGFKGRRLDRLLHRTRRQGRSFVGPFCPRDRDSISKA
jgi:hypothetical protein